MIAAHGLSDQVKRVGHCSDMPAAYRAASVAMADALDLVREAVGGDHRVELAQVAGAPLRIAGEHHREAQGLGDFTVVLAGDPQGRTGYLRELDAMIAAHGISTRWPFQAVRRAASSTTRSCGATPQARRRASTRCGATWPGVKASTTR
jgi:hypothetical protein